VVVMAERGHTLAGDHLDGIYNVGLVSKVSPNSHGRTQGKEKKNKSRETYQG
jgi:hypothetical protein